MRLRSLPASASSSPKGQPPSAAPPPEKPARVQPNLNVSIKKQIAIGRFQKGLDSQPEPKEATKTKFRRKKLTDAELGELAQKERLEQAIIARKPKLPGLRSIYNTKGWPNPPVVLVDGYNVLLQWITRAKECDGRDNLPNLGVQISATVSCSATDIHVDNTTFRQLRDRLLCELSQYSVWRDIKVMVAFDAKNHPDRAETERYMQVGIEVIWTVSSDADQFLIAEAKTLRTLGAPKVLVASNDREVVASCLGDEIFPLGSLTLLKDIRQTADESNHLALQSTSRAKPSLGESIYTPSNKLFTHLKYRPPRRW